MLKSPGGAHHPAGADSMYLVLDMKPERGSLQEQALRSAPLPYHAETGYDGSRLR